MNSFAATVEKVIELFSQAPKSLFVLLAAARLHVGEFRAGLSAKSWSNAELREGIEKRNALRGTITDNRAEHLESCAATRKLSEEVHQKKWEEILDDPENNQVPARTWSTTKPMSGSPSSEVFA